MAQVTPAREVAQRVGEVRLTGEVAAGLQLGDEGALLLPGLVQRGGALAHLAARGEQGLEAREQLVELAE